MAIGIIGGVVVSTLLSLVVVPAFYLVTDRMKQWLRNRRVPISGTTEPQQH
jgi:Cu/Ag efflux pump CusA